MQNLWFYKCINHQQRKDITKIQNKQIKKIKYKQTLFTQLNTIVNKTN